MGGNRLWERISLTTVWADENSAWQRVKRVSRECETCQACDLPSRLHTRVSPTPVPSKLMVSVAVDIFRLPQVEWKGKTFDSITVCVDHHSG